MSYYFTKELDASFDDAITRVQDVLKDKGFGVLTEIDIQATLKKKIDVDFYKYTILGACNPKMAFEALQVEDKIGLMLPCNVIVQQKNKDSKVEVSAINPADSMKAVNNDELSKVASNVGAMLESAIKEL